MKHLEYIGQPGGPPRGIKGEPVGIGRLERFVADYHLEHSAEKAAKPASNGHKVAVIGSGPAGLSARKSRASKIWA
jgi:glutamate synthase (NADPH/NADH) small chain